MSTDWTSTADDSSDQSTPTAFAEHFSNFEQFEHAISGCQRMIDRDEELAEQLRIEREFLSRLTERPANAAFSRDVRLSSASTRKRLALFDRSIFSRSTRRQHRTQRGQT